MKRPKFYIPEDIFVGTLPGQVLINTPSIGVVAYRVHENQNGDCWIKGDQIAKHLIKWSNWDEVPRRAFLTEEQKERYYDENDDCYIHYGSLADQITD